MTELLALAALHAGYGGVPVLHGIGLRIGAGAAVALLGANGAGKTTLLKAVMGLAPVSRGTIRFAGEDVTGMPPHRRARLGIGYCPEGRRPFPGLTTEENLAVACWDGAAVRRRRIAEMHALFPVLHERRSVPAWQLSGGQQQMLAIARSLMGAPRLLLLDEPGVGLSPRLADELFARIPAICATGCAVLLAEQNAAMALQACGRAVLLRGGRILWDGAAAAIDAGTLHAAFLGP